MAAPVDFNALRAQLMAQQQAIANTAAEHRQTDAELNAVQVTHLGNKAQLRRLGLSEPAANYLSGEAVIRDQVFSFLDADELEAAAQASPSFKAQIAEHNHIEHALIVERAPNNPVRAVELSVAPPALQRMELLFRRMDQIGESFTRTAESHETIEKALKVEAVAVAAIAAIVVLPMLPPVSPDIDDVLAVI